MCLTRKQFREWKRNPSVSDDENKQTFLEFILAYNAILRTTRIEHIIIIAILNCLCKENLIPDFISFNRTAKCAHNIKGQGYSRKRPDMIFCYTISGKKYYIISEIDEYAHSTYDVLKEKKRYAFITTDITKIIADNNTSNSVINVVNDDIWWVRFNPDTYKQGIDALDNPIFGTSSRQKLTIVNQDDFDKRINAYIDCIHNIISGNSDFSGISQYVKVFSTDLINPIQTPKRKSDQSPYPNGKKRRCDNIILPLPPLPPLPPLLPPKF